MKSIVESIIEGIVAFFAVVMTCLLGLIVILLGVAFQILIWGGGLALAAWVVITVWRAMS